ncbi:GntR family transcriptional regulator [Lysinibacillus pakistanensis]|uniref:GntR family transcriptional regulator n=1 Tax=Lysinibacillus pakistanensis TaxID=759811 RepID=A0AAX3WVU8_9BACI|nr:GntR family transcriptional regulator [Lysinibacillus pakistanensis]MDM5230269.1 GntR family transcriptional regulator [Lysinibacillus pakistanensis]WHY45856.1 GntR family transcriptional regulator [Lysinibacillus pakistanensis]WHY50868.1 GntR family transcriptional regulator [Lysinibacillus pakistanensis]
MHIHLDSTTPIYIQIAEWLQHEIIANRLQADEKVYSQYQLAELFNINPATAGKGLTILLEEQLLYKKRGLGMFVATDAKDRILLKRRNEILTKMAQEIVLEAQRLLVSNEELLTLIQKTQEELK